MHGVRTCLRRRTVCKGIAIMAASLFSVYLLTVAADRMLWLGESWRPLVRAAALVCGAGSLLLFCFIPLARRYRDEHIALAVEERYPQLGDSLISAVELARRTEEGVSEEMVRAVGEKVVRMTKDMDFRAAAPRRGLKRAGIGAGVLAVLVGCYVLAFPEAAGNVLARLVRPHANIPRFSYTTFEVDPGDVIVARGESVAISIMPGGRKPARARFSWRNGSSEAAHSTILSAAQDSGFHHTLAGIMERTLYRVRAGDGQTREYVIDVADRPTVADICVEYTYPAYTGAGVDLDREGMGDISAVYGTSVRLLARASKQVTKADLVFGSGPGSSGMTMSGRDLESHRFALESDDWYSVKLMDKHGFSNPDPARHPIRALDDLAPEVRILEPEEQFFATPRESVAVACLAKDDFGIKDFSLVYSIIHRDEAAGITAASKRSEPRRVALAAAEKTTRQLEKNHIFALGKLSVEPGDVIEYYAEATDHDDLRGPNTGKSQLHRIIIISESERWEEILDMQERLLARLQALAEEQRLARESLEELRESSPDAGSEQLEKAAEAEQRRQEQLQAEAQKLSRELQELMKQMAEKGKALESLPTLDRIQQQLRDIAATDMEEAVKSLMEALGAKPAEAMGSASESQAQALQRLQELAKALSAMLPRQETDRLLAQAIDLALRQDKVRKETRGLAPSTLGKMPAAFAMGTTALAKIALGSSMALQKSMPWASVVGTPCGLTVALAVPSVV